VPESGEVGDIVISVLAGLRDHEGAVRRIVERIAGLATVEREIRNMPIDLDIRDHEFLGPIIMEAEQKGLQKGELTVLRRLIQKRFGPLPGWAGEKLAALPPSSKI
jgi:hypothetical protein